MVENKVEIGECVNLYIPKKHIAEFWQIISEAGFEKDGKGIVKYILETEAVEEDWEKELPTAGSIAMGAVKQWADANPEEFSRVKEKGSALLRNLVSKIAKTL